jgi:hypothetical protein
MHRRNSQQVLKSVAAKAVPTASIARPKTDLLPLNKYVATQWRYVPGAMQPI